MKSVQVGALSSGMVTSTLKVPIPTSMDHWIGKWVRNFAAISFHTKKLCSRLDSIEIKFYSQNTTNSHFLPPFGGLRGNVCTASVICWIARGQLPIRDN